MIYATFKCLRCGYQWSNIPGPTECPYCNHLYVKWLNYEEMRKEWDKEKSRTKKEWGELITHSFIYKGQSKT